MSRIVKLLVVLALVFALLFGLGQCATEKPVKPIEKAVQIDAPAS